MVFNRKKIDEAFNLTETFIQLPEDVKQKYTRHSGLHGWLPMARETLNKERPYDLKESFAYLPQYAQAFPNPDKDVPGFGSIMAEMFETCHKLSLRILEAVGLGLKLEDPYYFSKTHNPYTRQSFTTLRTNYYPCIKNIAVQPKQIRCGEHSDWGSVSLLFQDQAGGLEVMSRGKFQKATPIPGTVLVNIGDLMQRWSGDYFKSTIHRVVLPADQSSMNSDRKSLAFFAAPDGDCEIVSLQSEGAGASAPPIKTWDYLEMKMNSAVHA